MLSFFPQRILLTRVQYIYSHGGNRNAVTGATHTFYWFSVGADHLPGALSRLSAFFTSPLFTQSLTMREINAVNSEFKRNIQNDVRRTSQLKKHLSVPGHPWHKFQTGSYESITESAVRLQREGMLPPDSGDDEDSGAGGAMGRETRRRLKEWWEREYCAGRMTLAVLGRGKRSDYQSCDVLFCCLTSYRIFG